MREGELVCAACGACFAVHDGIADLLVDPPDYVRRERAGLGRFAEVMRRDGWDRERILALPDVDLPYWHGQADALRRLVRTVGLRPGARLLDVGSNTCWASNIFARLGLEVIALDISDAELQGLRTADYFIEGGETYFERLLSPMFEPALADETVDYVFCSEVLHHNDRGHLQRTLRELFRVLRPGGWLFMINEPMRYPLNLKRDHAREVAEFEGHEHVYFFHEYLAAARRAGFVVRIPDLHGSTLRSAADEQPAANGRRACVRRMLSRGRVTRRALPAYRLSRYAWRGLIAGDVPLHLYGRKPTGAGRRGAARHT